jgi:F-type H+-transporting ATPase subunit gamma
MSRLNEIKEQQLVVSTVGNFANSLQQIAAARMVKLRNLVLASRRFVDEATLILRELQLEKVKQTESELGHKKNPNLKSPTDSLVTPSQIKTPGKIDTAVIVVTSNQGLCGSYNTEIFKRLDKVVESYPKADYYVIGHKGQNYLDRIGKKVNLSYYPYNIPETVIIKDLKPLIGMFYYYNQIFLIYSKFINTATREVVFIELSIPNVKDVEVEKEKQEGKFIFEPNLEDLISSISARVRYALFRQQILDSKLSLYTAQMIAVKTAADNADNLMDDLQHDYNKARRKLVDRKIAEVQAGRSLWAEA